MSDTYRGSCLCGQVCFRLDGSFERFFLCHCERCRKGSGSAHAANLFSQAMGITWLAGQDRVRHFNLPQTRHSRAFCENCGSALPWSLGRMLVVPAGCLDTALDRVPDAHLFVASRAHWDHDLAALPAFAGLPS